MHITQTGKFRFQVMSLGHSFPPQFLSVLHNHLCIPSCCPLPTFSCQWTGCIKQLTQFSCANEQQGTPLLQLGSQLIQALKPYIYGKAVYLYCFTRLFHRVSDEACL